MTTPRRKPHLFLTYYISTFVWFGLAPLAGFALLSSPAFAQEEEGPEPPPAQTRVQSDAVPDAVLGEISSILQGVTTPSTESLANALHASETSKIPLPAPQSNTLSPLGDLDGDGVPEMLLKYALPDVSAGADVAPAPDSQPLWGVYLLSWDGAHWQASRLVTGIEDFTTVLINLGPPVGRAIAVIIQEGEAHAQYPDIFQVKEHVATAVWDSEGADSRYEPLSQGQVAFEDHGEAPAAMVVTGRADPGFLQVDPRGQRGFQVRVVYHWDGRAFIPAKTEYSTNQDYTVYRFIAALHLHDYRSAYSLVVPTRFLKVDSPTLDSFRQFVQDNWPELLQDQVFRAPEPRAGSPDQHTFVLSTPDKHYIYYPAFSSDGKFLLTGLTRHQEALPAEP